MIRHLRQRMKHFVCARPKLYNILVAFLPPERQRLAANKETECIIDGYPRSANTFAVVAFKSAGNAHLSLAHHTHVPATVLYGCTHNLPTVVLIRNPLDAVCSAVIFSGAQPRALLKEWIWFYRNCWAYRSKFVVASFNEVTEDFGAVIEKLNLRWGTSFAVFKSDDEAMARVDSRIEAIALRKGQGERQVAKPSCVREKYREAVQRALFKEKELLCEAGQIYERYLRIEES